MKNIALAAAALAAASLPNAAPAAVHSSKYSAEIHLATPVCVFFRLEGVSVADPTVRTAPWFALATSHPNFEIAYDLLLSANLKHRTISVTTTGNGASACGYAAVSQIGFAL